MHPMTSTAIVIRDEKHEIPRATARDRSMAPLEGEKRLMLAVLERAVDDFRTYANVPTGRGRWLFREVAGWFDSSETGPFDFEGICQATGLDPTPSKGLRSGWRPASDERRRLLTSRCPASCPRHAYVGAETSVDLAHRCS
jgi:hypothetical protein